MVKQVRKILKVTKPKKKRAKELSIRGMLPLFIITVCVVFSFVFTVLIVPLGQAETDIKFIFIMMLVVSTTVASAVAIMYHVFFLGK